MKKNYIFYSVLSLLLLFNLQQSNADTIMLNPIITPYTVPINNNIPTQEKALKKVLLKTNTPVLITNDNIISTENLFDGMTVKYTVAENVLSNDGYIVIAAGTPVSAQVTHCKKKGRIGKPAELSISNFMTQSIDGQNVYLSFDFNKKEKYRMGRSIALSAAICPIFLLMRGKDVVIEKGTMQTAYTLSDITLSVQTR